jgi:arsenite methyltransferase
MPDADAKPARLAIAATALSLIACYGTLALIAILSALGFTISLNETLWAGAIVTFAALAVASLVLGWTWHRRPGPVILGLAGAAMLAYAMYGHYSRLTELAGFALLALAACWDWRARHAGIQARNTP